MAPEKALTQITVMPEQSRNQSLIDSYIGLNCDYLQSSSLSNYLRPGPNTVSSPVAAFKNKIMETATAPMNVTLQQRLLKTQAEKEVLELNLKHIQTDLDAKNLMLRSQREELAILRSTVLDLQKSNASLKQQKP